MLQSTTTRSGITAVSSGHTFADFFGDLQDLGFGDGFLRPYLVEEFPQAFARKVLVQLSRQLDLFFRRKLLS